MALRVKTFAGLGMLKLCLWWKGQDYLEIEALWGGSTCSLIWSHVASQLMKKPHVSEDLTAVLIGISFSSERSLVRLAVNRLWGRARIWGGMRL